MGADQAWPFHMRAWPSSSTAMQKEVVGQDTSVKEVGTPYVWGVVHEPPSQIDNPPDEETQNVGLTQEMAVTAPQSPLVPPQPPPR